METPANTPASIADHFAQGLELQDERGTFRHYKYLQDLMRDYLATGVMEGATPEHLRDFFARFQLISDTIFDLETLAAEDAGTRS